MQSHLSNSRSDRPFYILSDNGNLGIDGIVTPFLETQPLSTKQLYFNKKIQIARALIERVNNAIKMRYLKTANRIVRTKEADATLIIKTAVALHNDSIVRGDLKMFVNEFDDSGKEYNSIAPAVVPPLESYITTRTRIWQII